MKADRATRPPAAPPCCCTQGHDGWTSGVPRHQRGGDTSPSTDHHVLTFAILLHPLRFPEHAIETCRDGIVELNTFFLITRRNLVRGSALNRLCDLGYHLTLSIRFFWQPYLIYHFRIITHMDSTDRPGGYTAREHYMVMISQVLLCVFNVLIVAMPKGKSGKKKKDA